MSKSIDHNFAHTVEYKKMMEVKSVKIKNLCNANFKLVYVDL